MKYCCPVIEKTAVLRETRILATLTDKFLALMILAPIYHVNLAYSTVPDPEKYCCLLKSDKPIWLPEKALMLQCCSIDMESTLNETEKVLDTTQE